MTWASTGLESVSIARTRDDAIVLAVALATLAAAELLDGYEREAVPLCREALEIARRHALGPASASAAVDAAAVMSRAGASSVAVRVCGAVDRVVEQTGEPLQTLERRLYEEALQRARDELGEHVLHEELGTGRGNFDGALDEAVTWLQEHEGGW
jgi:hypothetical protein